jgi:hypothetical protein
VSDRERKMERERITCDCGCQWVRHIGCPCPRASPPCLPATPVYPAVREPLCQLDSGRNMQGRDNLGRSDCTAGREEWRAPGRAG